MSLQRLAAHRPLVMIMASAALLAAACGTSGGGAASTTPASAPASAPAASQVAGEVYEVGVTGNPELGDILVGEDGKTLYLFTKDTGGRSVCSGDCAAKWPPFVLEDGDTTSAGPGVTGTLGSIVRDDGARQVTYDGAPLYYYAADSTAGDVNGQGVSGVWFVVPPSGSGTTGGPGESPDVGDKSVTIADFSFSPASLAILAGTTVTWTNEDTASHTVTADDGTFASGDLGTSGAFSQVFLAAGTFTYHCSVHPQMVGTVVVTP